MKKSTYLILSILLLAFLILYLHYNNINSKYYLLIVFAWFGNIGILKKYFES
jgi:hypothetical protein